MFVITMFFWQVYEFFCFQAAQIGDKVLELSLMFPAVDEFKYEFMLIGLLLYCVYNYVLIFVFYRAVVFFWNLLINRR